MPIFRVIVPQSPSSQLIEATNVSEAGDMIYFHREDDDWAGLVVKQPGLVVINTEHDRS